LSQDVEVVLVRTHLIQPGEDVAAAVRRYLAPLARPGDIGFVSEKIVAIGQRRCVPAASVRPGRLARLLSRFVARNPAGMGLRRPVVMEMALREAGAPRIIAAALVGAAGRLLGRRGLFYAVAGRRVAAIDGPNPYTIRPYAFYVVLAPQDVDRWARRLERAAGVPVAVVDANDLGVEVLGASPGVDAALVCRALAGNPMGQEGQRTPMGLIRRRA
jgi:F420-0:gamma-glutamyl ligase-like protein